MKVASYGGKLSITQRYDERAGPGERFTESDVILTGNGITLAFVNPNQILPGQTVVSGDGSFFEKINENNLTELTGNKIIKISLDYQDVRI